MPGKATIHCRTALSCPGAVIVVLGLSAIEAYRIQISVSEQHLEIYRRYAAEEAELSTLRRNLWLAGNGIRDFFIHSTPAQAQVLRAQLAGLRNEDERALGRMPKENAQASRIAA
jgi:hypothetical protein